MSKPKTMTSSTHEEELLSTIASLSPLLSLKPGTLELPNNPDLINLLIFPTSEPTLPDTQPSSSTNTQPLSSTLKTQVISNLLCNRATHNITTHNITTHNNFQYVFQSRQQFHYIF